MISELELLRQCISELEAKNVKLEAEKAELLKQVIKKDIKRDAENTELKSRVGKLEVRLAILEQDITEVTEQPQNGKKVKAEVQLSIDNLVLAVDVSDSMVDQQNNANIQLLEEILKVSDKEINELISEESVNLPVSVINQLKQYRSNGKANNAIPEVIVLANPSIYEENRKTDEFLNVIYKKKIGDEIRERKREKKLQDDSLPKIAVHKVNPNSETVITSLDPVKQKVEQDLRHELSAYMESKRFALQSGDKTFDIQISKVSLEMILTGSSKITTQNIVDLFRIAIKVRQKEILCWYCFYKAYEDRVRDIKSVNNINDQSARILVYNEIKALLSDITDVNLRQKKFRAKRNLLAIYRNRNR